MDVKYDASCANGALDNNFSERKRSVATYKLGRKTELSSVDGGTYYYDYDASSNMIHMSNTRLLNEGRKINYIYDGLNRLTEKRYEDKNGNPVVTRFTYGKPDSGNFSGRLVKTEDATGTVEVEYGSLGEIKKEVRVMKQNHDVNGKDIEAVMEYTGNYLGQMEKMKYPDGEEITYIYDDAGQICSIKGNNDDYVDDIGYDECGQRIYIKYSNGVETTYNYKKETRLLDAIKTTSKKGLLYQNIKYDFTKAGNIERYTNDCLSDSNGGNYKTWQEYGYDSLYQLTYVHGETEFNRYGLSSPEHFSEYEQTFSFDRLGNMKTKKSSEVTVTGSKKGDDLNYEFDYEVEEGRAHRYSRIGTRYYKYDEVGNLLAEQTGAFGTEDDDNLYRIEELKEKTYGMNEGWGVFNKDETAEGSGIHHRKTDRRTYEWNAENQLVETSDEAITVGYTYGADGKRASKYTHNSETLYFNDYWVWHIDNATKDRGGKVTKNIYLGTERLASRIGSYNTYAGEENENTFFYHSDHLGSAQLVTDCNGDEYQRIEYTPYGETWIDLKTQISLIAKLPYKFSAKELDEETGLYYYGARYLDPKYSRWISADPAISDYMGKTDAGMGGIYNHVNFNLYHYAGNNPINYTDPDGRDHGMPDYARIASSRNYSPKSENLTREEAIRRSTVRAEATYKQGMSPATNAILDNRQKLNELRVIAKEIRQTDMAGDRCINFKPSGASDDGCFARTSVIAEYLRGKGFKVNYAVVNHPKWIDNGNLIEYNYHIAACVELGDENYVVDPMLNCEGPYSGLSKFSDWRDFQKPLNDLQYKGIPDTGIYPGYDARGEPIENGFIRGFYARNKNPSLTVPEYSERWLENFVKTRKTDYDGF